MTENPDTPPETPRASRPLRLLLAASLALNLLGGGYLAGAAFRAWRAPATPPASIGAALRHAPPEARATLRALATTRQEAFAEQRAAAAEARARAVAAAAAEPFDPEALEEALDALRRVESARAALRHAALVETVAALPPEARAAFLARLDDRRERRGPP